MILVHDPKKAKMAWYGKSPIIIKYLIAAVARSYEIWVKKASSSIAKLERLLKNLKNYTCVKFQRRGFVTTPYKLRVFVGSLTSEIKD